MQIALPFESVGYAPNAAGGFRLQRFEVFNWGTFDKCPWKIDLQGQTGLLTGKNGSGKSTLVDGLLTLLVPNKRRNYNQASNSSGKRERDEKSYIQGAFGRTKSEESYGYKAKFLREKNPLSVLLAYFSDPLTQQEVTLAQVLWMEEGSARKFFAIADRELSIKTDFPQFGRISDLKKHLRANGVEIFEEFSKYSYEFRKRVGLQSEKALDLFNQTVSIKEIGGLNDFVRNHMLQKADVQTKIRELLESYDNLTVSHDAIQKARKQLESLVPLTQEAEKFEKLKQEVTAYQQYQSVAPAFFASKKLELLAEELQNIERQLIQIAEQKEQSDRRLETLRQQEKDLDFAIKQDSIGQRLQELARNIEHCQQEVNGKKRKAEKYDRLAQQLNLPNYEDRDTFYQSSMKGEEIKQEINAAIEKLEEERDERKLSLANIQKQERYLKDELDSLRRRKSQIPRNNLDIRDRIARELNLDESELPFIGELLQVRPEAREWEGAIERLLHGFGLRILVPETHFRAVNSYVDRTHLKGRLVYYPVKVTHSTPVPTQRPLYRQQIPSKLEIKPDNETFAQWLRDRLVQEFNYVCCDSLEQFHHEVRAITIQGLVKHSGERHEKEDRSLVSDRSQYILGWNNASKIKALETDLQEIERQLVSIERTIKDLENQRALNRKKDSLLQEFMSFTDFAEIDWRTTEQQRLDLQRQRQELEASSDRLKQLEIELQTTQAEINRVRGDRDRIIGEMRSLEDRQYGYEKDRKICQVKVQGISSTEIANFERSIAPKLSKHSMTLQTIDRDETDLRDYLQEQLRKTEREQETSRSSLNMRIVNFKRDFPESVAELDASLEYLNEYLKLKEKIEWDDLPRHEKKFKKLMDEEIIKGISFFKSELEEQQEDIQEAVDELNQSLRKIDYTDSTYIKICCENSRNTEIKDFKYALKDCLGNVARQSAEDNEERFQKIQKNLIERFKSEERWTALVTDVRNWLDFSARECYREDDTEKEYHTDSSGKSGGQKVKLAYTILASAIAYQFGLDMNAAGNKSFRFVVIDEAFSKSDDNNARYAMELFKNLNLQLLVITPKDKINVIEPYINSLHLVSNVDDGNCSRIVSLSIEEYRQQRQIPFIHNGNIPYSN